MSQDYRCLQMQQKQCPSPRSCVEFKHYRRLAHIITICREGEQAAEGDFFLPFSQVGLQRSNRHSGKGLRMTCVIFFLLALTFLMGLVGKDDTDVQDYDADIFLPTKALWLFGCLLLWTVWLLLRLLQMFLWLIKGLLWFISISVSPLCHCLTLLLSCLLLLLHYMCDAVFFATTSPVFVYSMLLSVGVSYLIFTR
ncbi:uncharacterized protein LOC127374139 isoform X2 [Dicentrarchus labrax]|uniref:uncharacterized protein LOC127374139 isoform X2 n=1 Tax=Dicentrarchus labrax TaxID=13489 RepID=UPI0021F50C93|nr:uncharacterized protein LOC127374139 isoform X2 [Dicentrarchus labrax]